MANERLIAQVASLETEVKNIGEDVREMRKDYKEERELFWKTFRTYQEKNNKKDGDNEKQLVITLEKIRNDLKDYKKECDDRQKDANAKLAREDRKFKRKMAAIISVLTSSGTVFTTIIIEAGRAHGWWI